MVAEAVTRRLRHERRLTASAARAGGELVCLPDGRAGYLNRSVAAAANDRINYQTDNQVWVPKTTGIVILDGQETSWDHSANKIVDEPANDRDFYAGTAVGDYASAATEMLINLNARPRYIIDLPSAHMRHVPVLTAGTPILRMVGGNALAAFSLTAEAQKLDLLSERSFPLGSNWILEAMIRVVTNADADVGDLNIGVANGTHASDADAITESCFVHLDMGADLNIDAESDDGTTEVAATDTTIDWAVGTTFRLMMDGRDPSDIQIYINGALVLGSTVFTLAAATGPLRALFIFEKSSNDSPGEVEVPRLRVRIMDDDTTPANGG